jgi:outer membrane protein OmpA-like peptidoglycan-associated protein
MPDKVPFGFDVSDLCGEARQTLNSVIAVLRPYSENAHQRHGLYRCIGADDYNLQLSERHAAAFGD